MKVALSRAEEESSRVGETVDPWTAVFYTPGEFTGIRTVVYNELALLLIRTRRPSDTPSPRSKALKRRCRQASPTVPARSVLFDQTTLATGSFRLDQLPAAIDAAVHALRMAEAVRSARAVDRLVRLTEAAGPFLSQSGVKDICYEVRRLAESVSSTSAATRSLMADLKLG
ncbi:hypothetical protein [Nocardia sp. NPDC047654]|uniref:hypothetical protein n=1 Tax=Nocardia sp. NPDC047654 TaxID=3364314 RepID=UPI003719829F